MKSILGWFITSAWARQPGTELSPHAWSSDTSILLERLSGYLYSKNHFLIHMSSTKIPLPLSLTVTPALARCSPHKFLCWICCLHQKDRDPVGSFLLCERREEKQESRVCHLDISTLINKQCSTLHSAALWDTFYSPRQSLHHACPRKAEGQEAQRLVAKLWWKLVLVTDCPQPHLTNAYFPHSHPRWEMLDSRKTICNNLMISKYIHF